MASGLRKALSGISGLSVCVCVLNGVCVITWRTAHDTEKQTQAVYTAVHGQRDRGRFHTLSVRVCVSVCVNYDCVYDTRAPHTQRHK